MNYLEHVFIVAGLMLLLFFALGYVFQRLRIPSLLAYVFLGLAMAGLLIGPEQDVVHHISRIGIVLLFFLLGLHFPLNRLVSISRRVWRVGVMDIVLNFGVSSVLAVLFGFELLPALIIGGVAYASSSSITVKMLEETGRTATPEGEFKLALLIFEDIAAPVMVSILVGLSLEGNVTAGALGSVAARVLLLTALSLVIAYYGFRRLSTFIRRYMARDFMPALVVAVAFLAAGVAEYLGLSKLLGAFLAGVMLSETGAARELGGMLTHVKDLALPFFFFEFGTSISFGAGIISPALLGTLIFWALVAKLVVGFWGGRIYGLSFEGSLRAGFSLFQRGEFSVVIAAIGDAALRVFCGFYIIVTALIGVLFFRKAPAISDAITRWKGRRQRRPGNAVR